MPEIVDIFARLFAHTPATVFSTLGLLLAAGAGGLAYRALRLMGGEIVGGTIVSWNKRRSGDSLAYAPVVRFQAGVHGEFEVQSSTVFQKEEGDINVPVMMRYDPRNPRRADIEGEHHPWRPVVALLVLAIGALTMGWQAGGLEETDGSDVSTDLIVPD